MKFDLNFILSLVGALAWTPVLLDFIKKDKISGKVISQYTNFGTLPFSKDRVSTIFCLKLGCFQKIGTIFLNQFIFILSTRIMKMSLSAKIGCGDIFNFL